MNYLSESENINLYSASSQIAFVNGVPDTVSSTVYMFADDTKMYNRICDINSLPPAVKGYAHCWVHTEEE